MGSAYLLLGLRFLLLLLIAEVVMVTLPGVKGREGIMVWEMSASVSVWSMHDQYVAFRSYALTKLSDMGYFDHLLGAMSGSLRIIQGIGATTGIVCVLRAASVLALTAFEFVFNKSDCISLRIFLRDSLSTC